MNQRYLVLLRVELKVIWFERVQLGINYELHAEIPSLSSLVNDNVISQILNAASTRIESETLPCWPFSYLQQAANNLNLFDQLGESTGQAT